jgi:sensor histidine kinase YesM
VLLYVLSIVLAAAALLVLISEKGFVRPLVRLAHSMRKMPEEGMKFQNPYPDRADEIGILYRCFAKMLQQIQTLIEEKYKSEIRYLKSCLQSLMSQINAHFLFNTLETINCCAEIEQNRKIAVMSKSLGDILRYSIDYETDEVPLRKEVEQTQKYINIQEIKFGHPIQFMLDIEEGLLEHMVMKFLMQPIVENAIEHGLSGMEAGELILRAYHREDTLYLCFENNGRSMDEERLAEVRRKIYNWEPNEHVPDQQKHAHIGLFNIHQRIQLLYSTRYGLTVDNRSNGGVVVQVTMPYRVYGNTENQETAIDTQNK